MQGIPQSLTETISKNYSTKVHRGLSMCRASTTSTAPTWGRARSVDLHTRTSWPLSGAAGKTVPAISPQSEATYASNVQCI